MPIAPQPQSRHSPETPPDGDFASYAQRVHLGGAFAPGEVPRPPAKRPFGQGASDSVERMRRQPGRSVAGWIVSSATSFAMGAMSYMALSEGRITIGGKQGTSFFVGGMAVVLGFIFLAAALLPLVRLARGTRLLKPMVFLAALTWSVMLVLYLVRAAVPG